MQGIKIGIRIGIDIGDGILGACFDTDRTIDPGAESLVAPGFAADQVLTEIADSQDDLIGFSGAQHLLNRQTKAGKMVLMQDDRLTIDPYRQIHLRAGYAQQDDMILPLRGNPEPSSIPAVSQQKRKGSVKGLSATQWVFDLPIVGIETNIAGP